MSSLKKLAIRGTVWTLIGYGASQVLRFGSNLILTRLLVPDMFGLMSLVSVFIMGLRLFSDLGIGPSIIQNKRGDDPNFLNTAWTLQIIRGFVLWLVCLLLAWPIANLYSEPRLLWLLPFVGLTTILDGFKSTTVFTLNRQIALGKLTMFELTIQVISLTVTVVWAWFDQTIWALVGGGLISSFIQMVWSHRLIAGSPNRLQWDQEAIKELFSFGRWIFISTIMTFLAGQVDKLILAKLLSFKTFGVYNIAFTLADIPRQIIIKIGRSVIFPVISKQADLPRQTLQTKILEKRWLILIGAAILLIIPVGFGDLFIRLLYDQRYADASWMMPILSLGLWHTLLYSSMSPALLAIGKPLYVSFGNFFTFLTISIGLPLAYSFQGLPGALILLALSDLSLYGAVTYGLWREGLSCVEQDLKATGVFLGLLALVLLSRHQLGFGLPIDAILYSSSSH
jgi:O-antigen/teichoic acid export membrane protein